MDMSGLRDSFSSTGAKEDEQDPMEEVEEFAFRVIFDVLAVADLESKLVTSVSEVSGHEDTLDVALLTNGDGVAELIAKGGADEKK